MPKKNENIFNIYIFMFNIGNFINYFQTFWINIVLNWMDKFFQKNEPDNFISDDFNKIEFDEENGYGQFVLFD